MSPHVVFAGTRSVVGLACILILAGSGLLAQSGPAGAAPAGSAPAVAAPSGSTPPVETTKVERRSIRTVVEADGVLVPSEATEFRLEPKAHQGSWTVLEALPHGSSVKRGQVIARFEDEKLQDAVKSAEWTLRVARRNLQDFKVRHAEYGAETQRELARSEKDLELAQKNLEGYLNVDRPLDEEENKVAVQSNLHSIQDQEDEIEQLGKMYKEDELTKETEEIVLKRANRNLLVAKKRLELFERRRAYSNEYSEPAQRQRIENAVEDTTKALRDLKRARQSGAELAKVEFEKLEYSAAKAEKELRDLRRDLKVCVVRSPHDGILIHGELKDKVAVSLLRRGSSVSPHQVFIAVAKPGALQARFTVKERDRYRLDAGMSVALSPEAFPDLSLAGSLLSMEDFPSSENTWTGRVTFGCAEPRLGPLLKCKVAVVTVDLENVLTLPLGAVFRKGPRAVCYVTGKSPFGVAARSVVTGPDDGKFVVIKEGLSEGEEVLLREPGR